MQKHSIGRFLMIWSAPISQRVQFDEYFFFETIVHFSFFCFAEDKWPETPRSSSAPSDSWADFTSMKPDDWPPLTQPESTENAWLRADEEVILSPTTAALTGGIASAIMARTAAK